MRFVSLLTIFLSVVFLFPPSSQAARFSGAYLLELCDMDEDGKEKVEGGHTACQAYIAGVIDYHKVLQSMDIAPKLDICVPPNTLSSQLHAIVLEFLRSGPEHDDFVAAPAVTMALFRSYPCQ